MACSIPHSDNKIQALVQKQIDEDMVHRKGILNLALQIDNACTTKEDLRKAYKKCNHILQESCALIDTFLKEGSDKDYELNLSMYRKATKLEKQMNAKLALIHGKYNHRSETHIGGSSSQTHEIGDVYLTAEELHQLHLDEKALREILEEQTVDEKALEEKIRQKQVYDDECFMEFGVMKIDSDYEWIPNFTNENDLGEYSLDIDDSDLHLTFVLRSSSSAHVEPSPYTPNPVTIIPGLAGVSNPAKINVLDAMNLAISAWTMDVSANTIANCFRHCKLRSTDNMTFENSDEGGESTQELQNLIKELGYRNAMDVEDVLTHPEENVVAQLLTDEEIIESVIGINKDDIDEEDDESSTMEPPSRNEAIKAAITLNNFLLSYEKTTPEVMAILVISISSDSSEDSVGTPAGRVILFESDPSEDPSSDHIPPLPTISPFLSSDDDTTNSDTPYTPPSPTHGTPFTEITASTKISPIIPHRRVMILSLDSPILICEDILPDHFLLIIFLNQNCIIDFNSDASSDSSVETHCYPNPSYTCYKGVQREAANTGLLGLESAVIALTERIAELDRDNRRLRGTTSVESQRVDRL
ncbi:hypothetical protein Tco_0854105 [Tanacetum coccineum]